MATDRETDILFGMLAVQLEFVDSAQLTEVAARWRANPSEPLANRMVESGLISHADSEIVHAIVDSVVRVHNGNVAKALERFESSAMRNATLAPERAQQLAEVVTLHRAPSAPETPRDLPSGAVSEAADRYEMISEHARGGMGRVLLVHDRYLGRNIALKELMGRRSKGDAAFVPATTGTKDRFLQEARITGQLEHPSIVPVYEVGQRTDGTLYYTMKLVRGETLAQAIHRCRTLDERLRFIPHFAALCQAIAYAHSRAVIHRDLKPGNVMIGEFGETIVLDWGLARSKRSADIFEKDIAEAIKDVRNAAETGALRTAYGHVIGTPAYMPPEQARGQLGDVDERSDVYSLGAILYEILTGAIPFTGEVATVLRDVAERSPVPVRNRAPHAPRELIAVCERAMARDKTSRYDSARELAEDVQRFVAGAFVEAYAYTTRERLARWARRYRTQLVSAVLALAVLAGVTVAYVTNLSRKNTELAEAREAETKRRIEAEAARQAAQREAYLAQMRLVDRYVDEKDFEKARETLNGTEASTRNWEWGYWLGLISQDNYTLDGHTHLGMSPKDDMFAIGAPSGVIELRRVADGALVRPLGGPVGRLVSTGWSHDGSRFHACGIDGRVRVFDALQGSLHRTMQVPDGALTVAALAPDNQYLAAGTDSGHVYMWNIETGSLEHTIALPDPGAPVERIAFGAARILIGTSGSTHAYDIPGRAHCYSMAATFRGASRDGRVMTLLADGEVLVCDTQDGSAVGRLRVPGTSVRNAALSADGSLLATATDSDKVALWRSPWTSPILEIRLTSEVDALSITPDGNRLAVQTRSNEVRIWRIADGRELAYFIADGKTLGRHDITPDGEYLVTGSLNTCVQVWPTSNGLVQRQVTHHAKSVNALALAGASALTASISTDRTIRVFDRRSAKELAVIGGFSADGLSEAIDINADGNRIVAAADHFAPFVIDWAGARLTPISVDSAGAILFIRFLEGGAEIALVSANGLLRIIDASTGAMRREFGPFESPPTALAVSTGGDALVVGMTDGSARVFDAKTWTEILVPPDDGQAAPITSMGFSATGNDIVLTHQNGYVRVLQLRGVRWETAAASPIAGAVKAAFGRDESRIFGIHNANLGIWDSNRLELLGTMKGCLDAATCCAYDPLTGVVLAGCRDGSVRLWRAAPWKQEDVSIDGDRAHKNRVAEWRAQVLRERMPDLENSSSIPFRIITTPEILVERIRRLHAALADAPLPDVLEDGFEVLAGPIADAVARLCLLPGDRILEWNGRSLSSIQEWRENLGREIELGRVSDFPAPTFELIRRGQRYAATFLLVPSRLHERTVELPRSRIVDFLRTESAMWDGLVPLIRPVNQARARELGEPPEGTDGMSGMWVTHASATGYKSALDALGLAVGDRILEIDNVPIRDLNAYDEQRRRLLASFEDCSRDTYLILYERGEFQRFRITVQAT